MSADKTHYLDVPEQETVSPSGQTFDGVVEGHKYTADANSNQTTLTYSFAGADSKYDANSYTLEGRDWPTRGLERLSEAEINIFKELFKQVEAVTNLQFIEVPDGGENAGTIRPVWITNLQEKWAAYAEAPFPQRPAAGDIWFSKKAFEGATLADFKGTAIHEFGHTVGLKHPHEARAPFPALSTDWDGREYSIMSYKMSVFHPSAVTTDLGPQTLMYLDILALQYLYGADTVTTAGNDTYSYDMTFRHYLTIWDAGGTDTFEVHNGTRQVQIDLTPGSWSNVGTIITYDTRQVLISENKTIFIPPEVLIENATGAGGSDILTGNHVANALKGNDGNDSLYGHDGDDYLVGGKGSDKAHGGAGNDAIWAGQGDTGNDVFIGGSGNDAMGGGAGDDLLIGGGSVASEDGKDTISGGAGNDTLVGGGWQDSDDAISSQFTIENILLSGTDADRLWAGDGDDLILAAAGNDTIGAGSGNDKVQAGGGNDRIFAYAGDDTIDGGDGNDLIYGGPGSDAITAGSGNDTMWGGDGDDTLTGSDGADTFSFTVGSGKDTITDFNISDDTLQLVDTATPLNNVSDVKAAAEDIEGGVLITLGESDTLLLTGISLSDLDQLNFLFG